MLLVLRHRPIARRHAVQVMCTVGEHVLLVERLANHVAPAGLAVVIARALMALARLIPVRHWGLLGLLV